MFTELPRYLGFPSQIWVEKQFAFDNFMKMFNGKRPLMVSTYQFKDKTTPIVDSLVFDIDSYFSLRIPYNNVKSLLIFCRNNKIPYILNFSGGKGFHVFILIKPIIPQTEEEKEKTKSLMYSVQKAIVEHCHIEAIDYPTMGRLHWLIRFPTGKYIRYNEKNEPMANGFYCRNIPDEDFDKGLKHISQIAKEPGEIPKIKSSTKSLIDIAKLLPNFKLYSRTTTHRYNVKLKRDGNIIPTIEALGLPCLKALVQHSHPTHPERIELVAWLKYLGYTDLSINAFIKNCNWTRYSYPKTAYQVSTIHPRLPKCTYLRQSYKEFCKDCTLHKNNRNTICATTADV